MVVGCTFCSSVRMWYFYMGASLDPVLESLIVINDSSWLTRTGRSARHLAEHYFDRDLWRHSLKRF